jgi:glycosyltransferase involved in cell wall biosynthesis
MPSVGLSMIVKNGADSLRPCLESARGLVEQIVIADTGSSDDTCEIAREFNATIVSVPWENDFAKARNAALEPLKTDWVLVLDADEELDRDGVKNIPSLLDAPDVGGYVTPIRNYVGARFSRGWDRTSVPNDGRHPRAKDAPAYFTHENCRFFRRHPKIYFTGRVHELVENQVAALGLKLESANFFIHHFGQLAEAQVKDSKAVFYRELLRLRVQEHPDDPLGWVLLGLQEYEYHNNALEGLRCFARCLALEPRVAEAWVFTGMIFIDLGKYQEALRALEQDRRAGKVTALREQLKGDALHSLGRWQEARLAYCRALKWTEADDPLLESKLGYTEVKAGQNNAGLVRLRRAAKAAPGMFAIHDRLMKACIIADRLPEAAEVAEGLALALPNPKFYLRAASIRAKLQQWDESTAILSRGLLLFPQSKELQDAHDEAETMRRRRNGEGAGGTQATEHHENRMSGGIR